MKYMNQGKGVFRNFNNSFELQIHIHVTPRGLSNGCFTRGLTRFSLRNFLCQMETNKYVTHHFV